jgi:phosphodiesterase/alkaline phosphatase D-like protein
VRAENTNTNTGGTTPNSATQTVLSAPAAPVSAAATLVSSTVFNANWAAATGATNYLLDVATSTDFTTGMFLTAQATGNVTTYQVTGLTANTTYYYRVRATNATPDTSTSSGNQTVLTAPAAPVAQPATSITTTGLTANWNTAAGAASYRLDVSTDNTFAGGFVSGFQNRTVAGGATTSEPVTGLTAGTTYYYRVRAANATPDTSTSSGTITVATVPDAPVDAAATLISSTVFNANWAASTGATSYELDVATASDFLSGMVVTAQDVGNVTTHQVTGLTENTTYYYRVRAVNTGTNSGGTSANSGTQTVLTAPAAPTGVDATGTETSDGFTASWVASAGTDHYVVEVASDAGFSTIVLTDAAVAGTSKLVSGLQAATQYWIRVRAVNVNGDSSGNSTPATVTTLPFLSAP